MSSSTKSKPPAAPGADSRRPAKADPADMIQEELRKTVNSCRSTLVSIEHDVDGLSAEKDDLLQQLVRIRDRCRAIDAEFVSKRREYESAMRLLKLCEEEYAFTCCAQGPPPTPFVPRNRFMERINAKEESSDDAEGGDLEDTQVVAALSPSRSPAPPIPKLYSAPGRPSTAQLQPARASRRG
ncbi:unnamed protein product [Amoebophrya sp. A120]|nr:unnamed protein product [Amoebophrya sp. A120]|eukprot:GSA120T00011782001.1